VTRFIDRSLVLTPQLIFTLYKSLQHTLKSFHSAVTNRFPVRDLNKRDSSASIIKCTGSVFSSQSPLELWRTQSQSYFTTGSLPPSLLRPTTRILISQLNTCGYSPYVTSFMMRGLVCRLQLLLVLASAVILRSESRGNHDHNLLSRFKTSLTWRARSPRKRVARL
jgi:hypothetical protein